MKTLENFVLMPEPAQKCKNNCAILSKSVPTQKLFKAFKMAFSCCFSLRENLAFLQTKFHNIRPQCLGHFALQHFSLPKRFQGRTDLHSTSFHPLSLSLSLSLFFSFSISFQKGFNFGDWCRAHKSNTEGAQLLNCNRQVEPLPEN